jgi:hypothetical protein
MSNPIFGRFSRFADKDLRYQFVPGLYCFIANIKNKVSEVTSFDWSQLDLNDVVSGTTYPLPRKH